MSFRKEFKIRLSPYDSLRLKSQLIEKGMKDLHPPREICSIYFDTKTFDMFHDSEEGSLPRQKVRVRRYPNTSDKMQLEIKYSSIEGRYKTTDMLTNDEAQKIIREGYTVPLYGHCDAVVEVRYNREYFEYENVRITIDNDISYRSVESDMIIKEPEVVLEIKAPIECTDDYLHNLVNVPLSRFSKYNRAILETGHKI